MADFSNNKPIYLQIVDLCHERILSGCWVESERIPSVRELGIELTVNSHTALKAYDVLQAEGVIIQRRGLGFFLAEDAMVKVRDARRQEFYEETLPAVFERMHTLGLTIDDIVSRYMNNETEK